MPSSTYDKYNALKDYLSQGKRTIEECAAFLRRDKRSAYRAINALKCDTNVRTEKKGRQSFFFVENRAKHTNDEIIKILDGVLKKSSGSAAEMRLTAPLQKLSEKLKKQDEGVMPESIVVNDDFIIDLGPFAVCDFEKNKEKYNRTLQAIKNCQKLKIEYKHTSTGKIEKLVVCPLKLIMRIDTLYLWAVRLNQDEERDYLFVFEQIKRMSFLQETFKPYPLKASNLYRYSIGKWSPNLKEFPPKKIVLEATREWSASFLSRLHFKSPEQGGVIMRENKTFIEMNLSITPEFKMWLFGMLDSVKIHEPLELKKATEDYLKEALKQLKAN